MHNTAVVMPSKPAGSILKNIVVTFRATEETKGLLEAIAADFGNNQSAAMAYLLKEYARKHGIKPSEKEAVQQPATQTRPDRTSEATT